MNVAMAYTLVSLGFELFFDCVDILNALNTSSVYYALFGIFTAFSVIVGMPVKTYFQPV